MYSGCNKYPTHCQQFYLVYLNNFNTAKSNELPKRICKISDRTARNIVRKRKVKKDSRLTRFELQTDLEAAGTKV